MPTYANYIPNPSFELATTSWTAEGSGSITRTTATPTSGTYSATVSNSATVNIWGGVQTTVNITPATGPYSLGVTISHRTENHSDAYNAGVQVTVYDLLPGAAMGTRQQVATTTYAGGGGRVTLTNFTPRSAADRLVITITTASSYYQAGSSSTTYGPYQGYTDGPVGGGSWIVVSPAQYTSMLSSPNWQGSTTSTTGSQRFGSFRSVTTTTTPTISGGISTARIDAVQLQQGATATAYVDGTTTGYAWSGSPHNSATLAMVQLEATATATSTGTIVVNLLLPTSADAFATSTGTLETIITGVGAQAFATSTGTLDVWQYGPMSASGTVTQDGTVELAALIHITAEATATSTGTLSAEITVVTFADAFATSTGTLEIGLPPDMEAHAFATSTGTLEVAIAGVMEAHGFSVSVGTLEVAQLIPDGAFSDFAIFGVTENDPLMSITAVSNGGTNTGASGGEWVRIYAEFVVPAEKLAGTTKLWPRTAFVVPGIRFANLPAASWQEFTRVQLEIARPDGGPSDYMDGGSVRALVYPDRLNLAPNAIYIVADNVFSTAEEITSPIDDDTAPALLVELAADADHYVTTLLSTLKPGATYVISMYVKPSAAMTDVGFTALDQVTFEPLSPATLYSFGTPAPTLGTGWRRISTTVTVPASGAIVLAYTWTITQPQVGTESFTIAGFLVEKGIELKPYFFNPGNDPEIRYHDGMNNPSGGVFYYSDYERKTYILNEALKDHVPSGIGIGEPEFNKIPHYDS
ncbi:hypothetical protein AB0G15_05425 [Streptosporangium sp. NPDC023825]|uniref:phage head spike fiber domain-containing protein n=1 Tax=Streptosporangium sp. NPDC023825 TaxID=3154909 RepID=UPI003436E086